MNETYKKYHRRSIRLTGYNYAQSGLYFVTLCNEQRAPLYGVITHGVMHCNAAGTMVLRWYAELENKFPHIRCHAVVVMPDHFHCILEIIAIGADLRVCPDKNADGADGAAVGTNISADGTAVGSVGADLCVCPENENREESLIEELVGRHAGLPVPLIEELVGRHAGLPVPLIEELVGRHAGLPVPLIDPLEFEIAPEWSPLSTVIQWFKTMTTNEYIRGVKELGWQPFHKRVWQRNYYEHIIRNERAYYNISNYIIDNPVKWHEKNNH